MERTYDQIEQAVKMLDFKWFTSPYSLNMVWERTSFEATNTFTDFLHICYIEVNKTKKILTIPATTKPGLVGSLFSPTTVEGITGTAVIQSPQQIIAGWQFRDTFQEFSHYPYFKQVGKVNYWRDDTKDKWIDKIKAQIGKLFGTHWHIMSQPGKRGSGLINNWSLGCMGAAEPDFALILPIVRKAVGLYGDLFTGTIIESNNIEK